MVNGNTTPSVADIPNKQNLGSVERIGANFSDDNLNDKDDVAMKDGTTPSQPAPSATVEADSNQPPSNTPPVDPQGEDIDKDLPTWLSRMIVYLREVAPDEPWQNLVSEFVQFEQSEPPNGVRFLCLWVLTRC